ncbi:MAG: YqhA family protein [Planctomycetota bacterium]
MLRQLLEISRYLMILPIVGSLILMLSVVISGLGMVLVKEWELVQQGEYSERTAKQLTLTVIEAIDMFLVGAISYLIAVGLYSLFIGDKEDPLFKRFEIGSLADLENKVIGVVVVAMAVGFVGKASDAPGAVAVMQIGAGIAVVIVALAVFVRFSTPPTEKK